MRDKDRDANIKVLYYSLQVVVCSFVYGGSSKVKTIKQGDATTNGESSEAHNDKLASPTSAPPSQNYISSPTGMWPRPQPSDVKSAHTHTGFDLTRGWKLKRW
jgi:hypothetical protein